MFTFQLSTKSVDSRGELIGNSIIHTARRVQTPAMWIGLTWFKTLLQNINSSTLMYKKPVLSQGEPRDAAVNFDTYRIFTISR